MEILSLLIGSGWTAMERANPDRFHLYLPPGDPGAPFLEIGQLAVVAAVLPVLALLRGRNPRGEHRGERERHQARDQDCDADRDRELVKELFHLSSERVSL